MHKDLFAQRVKYSGRDSFEKRVTFASGVTFAYWNFCTESHFSKKGNFCTRVKKKITKKNQPRVRVRDKSDNKIIINKKYKIKQEKNN